MAPRMPPERCRDCPLPLLTAFSLSREETVRLGGRVRTGVRQFRGGEYIFRAGDPLREAYTLFDGYAVVYRLLENGERQVIRFLLPGDLLYNLPDGEAVWQSSAKAVEYAVTCVLSHDKLNDLFENDIHFAHAIARIIDQEERLLEEHIADLGRRPAIERLGRLMLELFHRQRLRGHANGTRCYLPFRQDEIGDAIGLSSVYVSRLLIQLQEMGVFSLKQRRLEIPDFDAACRRLEYSPAHLRPRPMI